MYLNHTSPFNEKPRKPRRSRKKKGNAKTVVQTERPECINFTFDDILNDSIIFDDCHNLGE